MAEASDQKKRGTLPPYIAFKTLTDIIERMEREEPPTRVDGSYLETYAGGYRPTVINNLQTLGLLNGAGEPTDSLKALIKATEADRKVLIAEILRATYPDIVALPKQSTQQQFLEAFSAMGVSGDTRRKAIGFFLKAAAFSGLPTGTYWKTPPAATAGTRRRAKSAPGTSTGATETKDVPETGNSKGSDVSGETVVVDLGTAGRVLVNVDVRWLDLDDATFIALRRSISDLKALASSAKVSAVADAAEDEEDDEGGDNA